MTESTFTSGQTYQIIDPDPEYGPYIYALAVDYADGMYIADCWIVDEHGNVNPDYNVSPVPFHRDSVREIS